MLTTMVAPEHKNESGFKVQDGPSFVLCNDAWNSGFPTVQ